MIHGPWAWGAVALAFSLVAGCGGGGGGDGIDRPPIFEPDRVAPTVTYVTPSNNAADVGTNSRVTVTFSAPMSEASLASALTLSDAQSEAPVALQGVAYDAVNKMATLTPRAPLAAGRAYRATVSTAAKDTSGTAVASSYTWTFGTAAGADTEAPTLTSHSPAVGATSVATNAAVAMAFSEPMDVASVGVAFSLSNGSNPVPGTLAYVGQAAVFTPTAALAPQTVYVATLRSTAGDLAGNTLVGDQVWSFTTGSGTDTTPPVVVAVTPQPNSTNVARDAVGSVTFDEPIYPFVYGSIDGVVAAVSIDYATNTASVIPTAPLRAGGGYAASVSAMDLASNRMAAPYSWVFATAP